MERTAWNTSPPSTPLINALAESQSSAMQGVSAPPASLTAAVARVAAVDSRLGDDLSTKDRWTGLQDQDRASCPRPTGGAAAVLQAHTEVTDLTLALYDAVRRNSELNRDPDNDMSNLQQAVAVDMPRTVVQVSRMGDLAGILGKRHRHGQGGTVRAVRRGGARRAGRR